MRNYTAEQGPAIVNELTYRSYRFNRDRSPHIMLAGWATIFGAEAVERMEQRYQAEVDADAVVVRIAH